MDQDLSAFFSLQPEQLRSVIDLSIPEEPLPLDQLIIDCRDTLKHQVKTGKGAKFLIQPWTTQFFLNLAVGG